MQNKCTISKGAISFSHCSLTLLFDLRTFSFLHPTSPISFQLIECVWCYPWAYVEGPKV